MYLILKIFDLYSFLILLNILGSWIDPYNQISIFQWIRKFTDPYLKMFKIVIPIGNMNLDISAIIGLIVLDLVKSLLVRAVSIGGF
ncbi:YggT family protein [Leptotrichia buccalis]|jgi:hypothetical protein|uniref:YGGT family protein n=1 Tax=Leptotrichia buccalis (strain ATCC 14201 / DSM 1135 / JCM 12969 / NCTC 10249 / C-1013-b) TaxID=523794 RepID=C7NAZ8_LEPBD|nr:YggT family protein [Leptotrichia buccalis]ACV39329.1 protein of unknown function YGGT [Leptotrichia buccalis C-1013-b]